MCSAACRWLRAPWPVAGPDCMAKALARPAKGDGTGCFLECANFQEAAGRIASQMRILFFHDRFHDSFTIAFTFLGPPRPCTWSSYLLRSAAHGAAEPQELALHGPPKKDECARPEAGAAEGLAPSLR